MRSVKKILRAVLCAGILLLAGCGVSNGKNIVPEAEKTPGEITVTLVPEATKAPEKEPSATPTSTPFPTNTPTPSPEPTATPTPTPEPFLIVIDPGHQAKGNYDKEPNGPGSDVMKAKVSSGTQGNFTGLPEYQLNLSVALLLKEELLARGYEVLMTRETHEVDISNVERAQMANEAGADAFIRVHANSATSSKAKGVMTICQTKNNPYNSEWYEESRRLSELVLEEVLLETGAKKDRLWETDTMTGINWTTVPTTILEMGYMSNKEEDELLATEEYQRKIAVGVADAIDRFLREQGAQ